MFPLSRLYVNRILYVWEYIFLQSEAFGSLLYFTAVYTWGHVFRHLLLIFLPLWNQFKFSSKAIWGLTWGAQYPFPRKNTDFWKESKITLWKSHVPTLFWLINFLWVIPQWSESSTCLQIGFDFLSWVWFFVCFLCCLESFPQSLDFDTMQADVQLLLLRCFFFFLTWVSWAKWILHNLLHALLQLLPLCSKNVFLIFDYFVTQAYRMLTYYSLLCLINLTFWCAAQNSKYIWCLEAAVLCGKKCLFVNLSF